MWAAPEPEANHERLAPPLRDVARLLHAGYEPADIAQILGVDVREVARRAGWILLRSTEVGAALPTHLGLHPGSLRGQSRPLRRRVLRALQAAGWPRRLMASEFGISSLALRKELQRGGLTARRR